MTEDEKQKLLEHYGITTEQQSVYYYAGFRYSNLTDAAAYADRIRAAQTSRARQRSPARRQGFGANSKRRRSRSAPPRPARAPASPARLRP